MQNYRSKFKNLVYFGFLAVIFSFSFLIFNLDKAEASALSLSIDPPIIVINAIPPAIATTPLSIQNKSDTQVTLQIQLKSFKAKGENGEIIYSGETPEIFKNVQLLDKGMPVESITLGPNQQKNLSLSIGVPQETNISARLPATSSTQPQTNQAGVAGEVGQDYYFSVLFVSTNSSPVKSNSSINHIGITTNVLLSVGPKVVPEAILEEFSSNIFFEKGPVPFTVRVRNKGDHFIKPTGEIIIRNMFNQNIGKLDLLSVNILSDSIRAISNKDSSNFKHPTASWKETFLLGFYSATLNISMSDEGPTFIKTIHFFVFPIQFIILIIAIAIAIIMIRSRLKLYANKSRT